MPVLTLTEHTSQDSNASNNLFDRRREPRHFANESGLMRTLAPLTKQTVPVTLIDVSYNGARIRSPRALNAGDIVQISVRDIIMVAEVRHCEPLDAEFVAGLHVSVCYERSAPGQDATLVHVATPMPA